jgi:precorrin-6A synthase
VKTIFLIGIGAGDPEHLTVQAINALNKVDVFFVIDKGRETESLLRIRKQMCERYITNRSYRTVEIEDVERDRTDESYLAGVRAWHEQRAALYEKTIGEELRDGQCGAFLVWGDPAIYDSTLRIIEQIVARGAANIEYEVIPGISSIQALAARHRIALNRIGGSIHITTGRRLAKGLPADADDVVVMLDGDCAFSSIAGNDIDIYWGAYIGTEDEILMSGNLKELAHDIARVRTEARQRHGWIMDTYLLRRNARGAKNRS